MKTATVTEVKNGLSALLDQVKAGESVLVTDRGVPVARIVPVPGSRDATGRLERWTRAGIVRAGSGSLPRNLLSGPSPRPANDASVVQALIEERRAGP
jgi:prevent-host-death family protein